MFSQELIQEAIELFGQKIVNEVLDIVNISDSDGAWALFSDMGSEVHKECVEFLYFEN